MNTTLPPDVRFVVGKMALGQAFLRALRCCTVSRYHCGYQHSILIFHSFTTDAM